MREILPSKLWLGNAADATVENIMRTGVVAVLDLAMEELSPTLPRSTVYFRLPIVDGEQSIRVLLRLAVTSLVSLLESELPTLVYCRAGMSRSPSVTAAALSLVERRDLDSCLQQVVSGHPHDVSPQLWAELISVVNEIASDPNGR